MKKILVAAAIVMSLASPSAMAATTLIYAIQNFVGNIVGPMVSKAISSDDSQEADVEAFDEQNAKAREAFVSKLDQSGLDEQAKQRALDDFENSMDKTAFVEQWK